jgi:hypothetical protein
MSKRICPEAIQWMLRRYEFRDFNNALNNDPAVKQALTRGGFTLSERNFRQEKTTRRILVVLQKHDEFAHYFALNLAGIFACLEKMLQAPKETRNAQAAWLEKYWREKFLAMRDPRTLALVFCQLQMYPRLQRLGALLLKAPSFWRGKKNPTTPRKEKTPRVVPSEPLSLFVAEENAKREAENAQRQERAKKKQENAPKPAENAPVKAENAPVPVETVPVESAPVESAPTPVAPVSQGLLPLTKSHEAAVVAPVAPAVVQGIVPLVAPSAPEGAATPEPAAAESAAVDETASEESAPVVAPAVEPVVSPVKEVEKWRDSSDVQELKSMLSKARQRNGELSRENDALRKKARTQEELRAKAQRLDGEEKARMQKELSEIRDDFDDAIDELRDQFQETQRLQMASFYTEALGIHPEQLALLTESVDTGKNLEERANRLLAKQRERDKTFGVYQKLRDQEQRLDRLLVRVREALEESLSVEPGMTELAKELEKRVAELRKSLRKDSNDGESALQGIAPRMLGYLKELPLHDDATRDAFQEVRVFLQGNLGRRLFLPEEIEKINELLTEREKLFDRAREPQKTMEELLQQEPSGEPVRMEWIHRPGNRGDLKQVELVIDGYNVIKTDPIMSLQEKTANGFQVTRDAFRTRCQKLSQVFRKVVLVFDSDLPVDNMTKVNDHYTVVYAGHKTEDQNADNWIVQRMEEQEARGDAGKRWLVTNDQGLMARVQEICDGYLDNATFLGFLGGVGR